uniref:Uncharacterized protein n=1 Tax=Anopheles coluzzii TaxID=1518534 RepID=A0A8W7PHY7_ANOCL
MTQQKLHLFVLLFVLLLCHPSYGDLPDDTQQSPTSPDVAGDLDARAGPLDLRPPLPTTIASEKPTTAKPMPGLGELLGGGGGLPELGAGGQQSGGSPQASLILGAFQAIITPFNPGMLGTPRYLRTLTRPGSTVDDDTFPAPCVVFARCRTVAVVPRFELLAIISWRRESSACSIKPQ